MVTRQLEIATGGEHNKLRLIDAASGRVEREVVHESVVWSVAWKLDGLKLAPGGGDNKLRLIDAASIRRGT